MIIDGQAVKPDQRYKSPVIDASCFEQITTAQISQFISAQVRWRGLAPETANRYREIMVRLFNWSMREGGVLTPGKVNPAAEVERYREHAPQIRFLSLEDIDQQLHALRSRPQLQAMVAVLIYAGLRREELLWLKTDDIDLNPRNRGG